MLKVTPEVLDNIQRIYGSMWPRCLYCTDKEYNVYLVLDETGHWAVHSCVACMDKQLISRHNYKIASDKEIFYLRINGKC